MIKTLLESGLLNAYETAALLALDADSINGASVTFFVSVDAKPVSVVVPFSTVMVQVSVLDVVYRELLTCCVVMTTSPTFIISMLALFPAAFTFTIPLILG